ncbi:synaptotagmin-12-like [Tachypleus tridentatus]|uniref:synaptotagmin-12-like n=1 Tax=Tachypleus tridentatus TaxID=6853 RepID=UPI003FD12A12
MKDLAVAAILISISAAVITILYGLCRILGGWTWLKTWMTGSKEETSYLTSCDDSNLKGYSNMADSDVVLNTCEKYKHYGDVVNEVNLIENKVDSIPLIPRQYPWIRQHFAPDPSNSSTQPFENIIQPSSDREDKTSSECELSDILAFNGSSTKLKRALSCTSVNSDTSVVLDTLESPQNNGELEIGLEYDSETEDLIVIVNKARNLIGPDPTMNIDSYVRVFLLPDKTTNMQTRIQRRTNDPLFKERFLFGVDSRDLCRRSVLCYIFTSDKYTNTFIGETEINLADVDFRKPYLNWMPILDTNPKLTDLGDIMFSLSYLPTAERLTVVIVKARNLNFSNGQKNGSPFVKVYLLQNNKKISKKRTSLKKDDKNPIYNEAMIFSVPTVDLQQNIQLRITVADYQNDGKAPSLGHVFVGSQCRGKSMSHWNQMMSSLRKPIAMWHPLRK